MNSFHVNLMSSSKFLSNNELNSTDILLSSMSEPYIYYIVPFIFNIFYLYTRKTLTYKMHLEKNVF